MRSTLFDQSDIRAKPVGIVERQCTFANQLTFGPNSDAGFNPFPNFVDCKYSVRTRFHRIEKSTLHGLLRLMQSVEKAMTVYCETCS